MPEAADRNALLRAAAVDLPGDTPRLDAELLLAAAMGVGRMEMLIGPREIPAPVAARFAGFVARRSRHEPVAHILGEREFWSLSFKVSPDVLVPRPDSETLIAEALAVGMAPRRILDLGTGSGALLLAALSEWPEATGIGIDCSARALAVAQENAGNLGMSARAEFREGNWADGLEERFDLILCNPPYIEDDATLMPDVALYEPHGALFGGPDGLGPYRLLFPEMTRLLSTDGMAIFEFGLGQGPALLKLAAEAGLAGRLAPDLTGRDRVICLFDADRLKMAPNLLGKAQIGV